MSCIDALWGIGKKSKCNNNLNDVVGERKIR